MEVLKKGLTEHKTRIDRDQSRGLICGKFIELSGHYWALRPEPPSVIGTGGILLGGISYRPQSALHMLDR